MLRPLQILLIISWIMYYPERFPEVRVRNKLAQYPPMPLVITFEVNEDHPHPFYNTKFPRPLSRYGLLTQWSKDRGCAFSVLFLPLPTIFSLIRLLDICDSTQWYTCWYLVTNVVMYSPAWLLHAPISSSYNTGYQIYKKRISFTLRWCILCLWWRFGERDLFDWDFRDLRKEKCPLRSVKDNVLLLLTQLRIAIVKTLSRFFEAITA